MARKRQHQKQPPDMERQKALLRESDTHLRAAALKLLDQFKEPKYPASTITEQQKARNAKYQKSSLAVIGSIDRRNAKRDG